MRRVVLLIFALLSLLSFASFRPYPRPGAALHFPLPAGRSPASVAPAVVGAHSHNDYTSGRPLAEALEQGFQSVEADVYLRDGELKISHLGLRFAGSLQELYLDPLQKRVETKGSVYGDGKRFMLWLDVKEFRPAMVAKLHETLARYPMLSRYGQDARESSVVAILTGNRRVKAEYEKLPARFAVRDHWGLKANDPAVSSASDPWQWYALNWFSYVRWDGEEEIPAEESRKLAELVKLVHSKGRKLRFWGAPETPGVWRASAEAGVDLIGTDDRFGLREFLDRYPR